MISGGGHFVFFPSGVGMHHAIMPFFVPSALLLPAVVLYACEEEKPNYYRVAKSLVENEKERRNEQAGCI